jgi:hypothetical protein
MKLSEQIDGILTASKKLLDFSHRIGDSEEASIFSLSAENGGTATVYFFSHIDRDKALSFIGEKLGREGWMKKLDGCAYTWTKNFLGVGVMLYHVQQLNSLPVMLVDPTEFPIQLEDVNP